MTTYSKEKVLQVFELMIENGNCTTTERKMGYRFGWLKMASWRDPTMRFAIDAGRWLYRRKKVQRLVEEATNEPREAAAQSGQTSA